MSGSPKVSNISLRGWVFIFICKSEMVLLSAIELVFILWTQWIHTALLLDHVLPLVYFSLKSNEDNIFFKDLKVCAHNIVLKQQFTVMVGESLM